MKIISIDKTNIDREHICCALGADKANIARAETKKAWLKERFGDKLVFKRFDGRGKFFIEYMPIEKAWKPVQGRNIMLINCLWVSGQYKGKGLGAVLLDECVKDARANKKDGIAVVSADRTRPFLTDKKFFIRHGFTGADSAPPYFELLFLRLNDKAVAPSFAAEAKKGSCGNKKGFTFIYSNQCPFMEEYVGTYRRILDGRGVLSKTIRLDSAAEAQKTGCAFGTLGVYFKGTLVTHELMPEKRFTEFTDRLVAGEK